MIKSEILLGLPGFQITHIEKREGKVIVSARYTGPKTCAHCGAKTVRSKGRFRRQVRHEDWGLRHCFIEVEALKLLCRSCGRQSRQRLPGILPRQSLRRQFAEWHPPRCPTVLGIDEHFFTRRKGFATTFCDLGNHKIYDVVLGRSEAALEPWLQKLEGKSEVRVICMDLASVYRSLVRRHFPQARIVADRFHVIRIVNHHFLACWRDIDPAAAKNRGLLSLMRRHRHNLRPDQQTRLQTYLASIPALQLIYRFKQKLCYLLLKKHRTQKQCAHLAPRFLRAVEELRKAGLPQLVQLGETLHSWRNEIAAMWRFTRNNGITEGFHNKMELISRQAYGFRNFQNYRLRVKVLCS